MYNDTSATPELEPVAEIPGAESREQTELVESFIDSNGIERKAEYPLVLLDTEAREAVDAYFSEHGKLADQTEQCVDALRTAETLPLSASEQLDGVRLNMPDTPQDQAAELPPGISRALTGLGESKDRLASLPDIPDDIGYGELKDLLEGLPAATRNLLTNRGASAEIGFSDRLGGKRAEHVEALQSVVARTREEWTEAYQLGERELARLIAAEVSDEARLLATEITPERPTEPGPGEDARSLQRRQVRATHTPVENGEIIENTTSALSALTLDADQASLTVREICSKLEASPAVSAAGHLSSESRNEVESEIVVALKKTLEVPLNDVLASAFKRRAELSEAATQLLQEVPYALYQEEALPIDYIAATERDRLQQIAELVGELEGKRVDPRFAEQRIKQARVAALHRIRPAGQLLYHATGFASEIAESGAIRPKQRQIDAQGVLHEQMVLNHETGDDNTHTTVPHFGEKVQTRYILSVNDHPDVAPGVIAVPLGAIVERAPYDVYSRYTKVLPVAKGTPEPAEGPGALASFDESDDEVFYVSPSYEQSDEYEIPTQEAVIVIVGDRIPEDIPPEQRDKIVLAPTFEDVDSAIRQRSRQLQERYAAKVAVPLRQAALDFEPESPNVKGRRDVPLHTHRLDTSNLKSRRIGGVTISHSAN